MEIDMSDNKYNGWTNYATWRVNLELFDSFDPYEILGRSLDDDAYNIGLCLKEYAEETILSQCGDGGLNQQNLAAEYALAFINQVNWTEIAEHKIDEYSDRD